MLPTERSRERLMEHSSGLRLTATRPPFRTSFTRHRCKWIPVQSRGRSECHTSPLLPYTTLFRSTREIDGAFFRAATYGYSTAFSDFIHTTPVQMDRSSVAGQIGMSHVSTLALHDALPIYERD